MLKKIKYIRQKKRNIHIPYPKKEMDFFSARIFSATGKKKNYVMPKNKLLGRWYSRQCAIRVLDTEGGEDFIPTRYVHRIGTR